MAANKERFLIENMKLDEATAKAVTEIGRLCGTNKYDIWIAKLVKKQPDYINQVQDFSYILDWAKVARPNILEMSFEDAMTQSKAWHDNLGFTYENMPAEAQAEEDEKIIYRCRDGKHYFTMLEPHELGYEGQAMRHCVGGYGDKVRKEQSLILSLRDSNNEPHVTIEIDTQTRKTVQIRGKANQEPAPKYQRLITEYAFACMGPKSILDQELLELLGINEK